MGVLDLAWLHTVFRREDSGEAHPCHNHCTSERVGISNCFDLSLLISLYFYEELSTVDCIVTIIILIIMSATDRPDSFFNARDTRGGLQIEPEDKSKTRNNTRYHDDFGGTSMDRVIPRPAKTSPPASPRPTESLSAVLNSPRSVSSPKPKKSSSASVGPSLGSMLESASSSPKSPNKKSASNTVAGDGSNSNIEIKVLPDGRKVKVKRVLKKASSSAASVGGSPPLSPVKTTTDGEFYRREDGKLVKRVVRRKSAAGNALQSASSTSSPSTNYYNNNDNKNNKDLSNLLERNNSPSSSPKKNSSSASVGGPSPSSLGAMLDKAGTASSSSNANASATVAGDQITTTGEITILPDGRKVRKVMRRASVDVGESFVRKPDGTLVKRVVRRKSTAPPTSNNGASSLADLLDTTSSTSPTRTKASSSASVGPSLGSMLDKVPKPPLSNQKSASNTVAGDQIASTGEITTLPDGRKVRKVIRRASTATASSSEVIRREDGTLVKRVIRRKSEAGSALASSSNDATTSGGLSDFMAKDITPSSPKKKASSAASVGAPSTSLGAMLDSAEQSAVKNSAANTVAGDSPRRGIFRRKNSKADVNTINSNNSSSNLQAASGSSRSLQSGGSARSMSTGDDDPVPLKATISQDTDATPTTESTKESKVEASPKRSGLASFFGLGKRSKSKASSGGSVANTVAGDMNIRSSSGDKITLRHDSKVKKVDNMDKGGAFNPADPTADGSVYRYEQ